MKKILVGLDGSPRQRTVVAAAEALARQTNAKLVLFRAITLPTDLPQDAYLMPPAEVTRLLQKHAQAGVDEAAASLPGDLVDRQCVAVGVPWQAICQAAVEHDVDIIVVGSHGYDTLDRVLGTTAAKIVNHADRSVLVVRAGDRIANH